MIRTVLDAVAEWVASLLCHGSVQQTVDASSTSVHAKSGLRELWEVREAASWQTKAGAPAKTAVS